MTLAVRIPKRFYDDCQECGTETPTVVKTTARHYWLDLETERDAWDDFRSRAESYADNTGFTPESAPICAAARAFLKACSAGGVIENIDSSGRILPSDLGHPSDGEFYVQVLRQCGHPAFGKYPFSPWRGRVT